MKDCLKYRQATPHPPTLTKEEPEAVINHYLGDMGE